MADNRCFYMNCMEEGLADNFYFILGIELLVMLLMFFLFLLFIFRQQKKI